jgi:hypothetical protein
LGARFADLLALPFGGFSALAGFTTAPAVSAALGALAGFDGRAAASDVFAGLAGRVVPPAFDTFDEITGGEGGAPGVAAAARGEAVRLTAGDFDLREGVRAAVAASPAAASAAGRVGGAASGVGASEADSVAAGSGDPRSRLGSAATRGDTEVRPGDDTGD